MKSKIPRGARMLCQLVASPLADIDNEEYRRKLKLLADNRRLNKKVRDSARRMWERVNQSPSLK